MPTAAQSQRQAELFFASPELERAMTSDDGQAAQQHLDAGSPIYYGDARFPEDLAKKYPHGRKPLVSVSADGRVSVIRDI